MGAKKVLEPRSNGSPTVSVPFTEKAEKIDCTRISWFGQPKYSTYLQIMLEGAVASWLVRSWRRRAVRVRALPRTLCCVLGQDT